MTEQIHSHLLEVAHDVSTPLHHAIKSNGPLPLRKRGHQPLGEVMCRTIAGQQLSVKAASSIWQRVLDRVEDRNLIDYVHRARTESLRKCGLSASKVKAIKGIAQATREGILDRNRLKKLESVERAEILTRLWGVGQWTADMLNMFYFQDADIWPDGDVAARKTLEKLTSKRRKTIITAERFSPFRSYLAMHMWSWADNVPT